MFFTKCPFSQNQLLTMPKVLEISFTLLLIASLKNLGGVVCPLSSENLLGIFFLTSTIQISRKFYFYYQIKNKNIYFFIFFNFNFNFLHFFFIKKMPR